MCGWIPCTISNPAGRDRQVRWGKVEVTGGFLLLMAWINYCDTQKLLPVALCAAALHEFGHWMAVRTVKGRIVLLRLSAVGAQLQLEGSLSYVQEILCALAGPLLNLAAAFFAASAGHEVFTGINLALGVFNLLPISALDGGRILDCAAAMLFGPEFGSSICKTVDFIFSAAVGIAGALLFLSGGSVTLMLIAVWIWKRMAMHREADIIRFGG